MCRRAETATASGRRPCGSVADDGSVAEEGSATVYVLASVVLLLAVALLAAGFAGLAAAKHRAAAAADLAALAGASAAQPAAGDALAAPTGAGADGCAVAASTARRNRAQLTACAWHGDDITVTVSVTAVAPFGYRPVIQARAWAGPRLDRPSGQRPP